jgi:U5 small nuclear ribonucleoprotein component
MDDVAAEAMIECKQKKCPLMIQITKLYSKPGEHLLLLYMCLLIFMIDGSTFDAFGRIFSGSIRTNEEVKVLGENYSLEDEEDMMRKTVTKLWIAEAR